MKTIFIIFVVIFILTSLAVGFGVSGVFAAETRSIFFPTDPSVTFTDSFGDARYGHSHEGIDLMGQEN